MGIRKLLKNYKLHLINFKMLQTNNLLHIYISYFYLDTYGIQLKTESDKIERSLFIKKIIKILDVYTYKKLDIYIIFQNIQKYMLKLKSFVSYCSMKKNLFLKFKK